MRLKHLEEQAMFALKTSVENFENPVFPNAMIAGDCVITHMLGRLGYLDSGKCKIMVVDTFHLFPETMPFLAEIEKEYGFKAEIFGPEGVPAGDKPAYDKKYGANLWREDIEQYDKVCKVEPFQRGLKTLNTDCMINGRTRWQGLSARGSTSSRTRRSAAASPSATRSRTGPSRTPSTTSPSTRCRTTPAARTATPRTATSRTPSRCPRWTRAPRSRRRASPPSRTTSGSATRPSGSTTPPSASAALSVSRTRTAPSRPSAASTWLVRRRPSTATCGRAARSRPWPRRRTSPRSRRAARRQSSSCTPPGASSARVWRRSTRSSPPMRACRSTSSVATRSASSSALSSTLSRSRPSTLSRPTVPRPSTRARTAPSPRSRSLPAARWPLREARYASLQDVLPRRATLARLEYEHGVCSRRAGCASADRQMTDAKSQVAMRCYRTLNTLADRARARLRATHIA